MLDNYTYIKILRYGGKNKNNDYVQDTEEVETIIRKINAFREVQVLQDQQEYYSNYKLWSI